MIHHSVLTITLMLLIGAGACHAIGRTVLNTTGLPDVTRLLMPVVGLSLVVLQLLVYGFVRLPWTAVAVVVPWAAVAVLRYRPLQRALASDIGRAWAGVRAVAAGGPVAIGLALGLLLLFAVGLVQAVVAPLEGWDAVAVWMLKAKLFFLEQSFSLAPLLGDSARRLDYPPLFPGWSAAVYSVTGGVHDSLGKAIDGLLMPILTMTVVVAVRPLTGTWTALVLGLVVAGSPLLYPFVYCSCELGYADFAVGVLAASALAHVALTEAGDVSAAPGALLAAALAALVKNEGVVLMIATGAALAILPAGRAAARSPRSWSLAAVAVAAVPAWQAYIRLNGLRPDYVGGTVPHLGDAFGRLGTVLRYVGGMIAANRDYQILAAAAVLSVILVLAGGRGRWAVSALLGIQLASYVAAFVVSPYPLVWQLETSAERLVAQVMPAIVLAFGLGLGASWSALSGRAPAIRPGGAGPRGWRRRGPSPRGPGPRG